ncbi:MAG: hypothetical protein ACI8PZ_000763 [Myxococcota bacterium]|jgi:hypothetical protein
MLSWVIATAALAGPELLLRPDRLDAVAHASGGDIMRLLEGIGKPEGPLRGAVTPDTWGELDPPIIQVLEVTADRTAGTLHVRQAVAFKNPCPGTDLNELTFRWPVNALPAATGTLVGASVRGVAVEASLVDGQLLDLKLPETLPSGAYLPVVLETEIQVPLRENVQEPRLFFDENMLVASGFLPFVAACGPQGFDRATWSGVGDPYAAPSTFLVATVTAGPADAVITSGEPLLLGEDSPFVMVPARDFAVVVGDLQARAGWAKTAEHRYAVTVHHHNAKKHSKNVQKWAAASLADISTVFGPLSIPALDVVLVPFENIGLELPGMVLIPDGPHAEGPHIDQLIVAHEVAHQWFYGEVGSAVLEEPWVDEAVTMWVALAWLEHREPGLGNRFLAEWAGSMTEAGVAEVGNGHASLYEDGTFGMVYIRGAMFWDEAHRLLGDDGLKAVLKAWVQDNRWRDPSGMQLREWLRRAIRARGRDSMALEEAWNQVMEGQLPDVMPVLEWPD